MRCFICAVFDEFDPVSISLFAKFLSVITSEDIASACHNAAEISHWLFGLTI